MNEQDSIRELGSTREKNPNGSIHCLTIIGQIEGHQALPDDAKTTKYEHVMPLLAAVEEQSREEKTAEKMVDRVNTLKDLSRDMAEELGREATVEELARRMELTADEIRDIMKMTLDAMSVMGE